MTNSLILLTALVGLTALTSCGSDDADTDSTEAVVAGAPLTITGPALDTDPEGSTVVIGTLSNVTDRTVEIVGATSPAGDVTFRSGAGEETSLVIEPNSELVLDVGGTHLLVAGAGSDVDTVEVTLLLDIDDRFVFDAERVNASAT